MLAPTAIPMPPLCHRADPRSEDAADRLWWLCYSQVRHEKRIAAELLAAGVPHLLPLVQTRRVTPSGNRVTSEVPLFPGYIFACGDELDRLNAMQAAPGRLLYTIPIYDVARLITDLSQLMDAIDAGAPLGKAETARPGDRVRVASGPWEDKVGTLVREKGRDLLLLHVHCLGQVVPLEIESWRVELIEDGEL